MTESEKESEKKYVPKLPPIPRELAKKVKEKFGWDYPIQEDQPDNDEGVLLIDDSESVDESDSTQGL